MPRSWKSSRSSRSERNRETPLKRFLYQLITPVRTLYWFVFRPRTQGVKVIVLRGDEVLLIKNAYGKAVWTLPGGGIGRQESPEAAALREVAEEVGMTVSGLRKLGESVSTKEYKRDTIHCFVAEAGQGDLRIDRAEVQEARWFQKGHLPADLSSMAKECLMMMK